MAGVDSRCRVQKPCAQRTGTRVARETVALPTVWQGATMFPNTHENNLTVTMNHQQLIVELSVDSKKQSQVVLECCRIGANRRTQNLRTNHTMPKNRRGCATKTEYPG